MPTTTPMSPPRRADSLRSYLDPAVPAAADELAMQTVADFGPPPRSFVDREDRPIDCCTYHPGLYDALVEMYHDFDPAERAQGVPPASLEAIDEWLAVVLEGTSVLAIHENRVVGHVMFLEDDTGVMELGLFVHQSYQDAGIGTRLLDAGLALLRRTGVEQVTLCVARWNTSAITVYRNAGFETTTDHGTARRMSKRLTEYRSAGDD